MDSLIEGAAALLLKVIPNAVLDAVQRKREADLARIRLERAAMDAREARRPKP